MSLVGSTFGPSYSTRSPYSDFATSAGPSPQPRESANPYQDLMQASRSSDAYETEMSAFNELLAKVKGMDGKDFDRNPEPSQVVVISGLDQYSLRREGTDFKLSHTETEPWSVRMMSMAGPEQTTTTYTIKPDQIVKQVSNNRRADQASVVIDTVNGYILS